MLPQVGFRMSELEDTVEEVGANSIEETCDGGDKNLIHLNSMSLNKAIALMQKACNFQVTRPYCKQ